MLWSPTGVPHVSENHHAANPPLYMIAVRTSACCMHACSCRSHGQFLRRESHGRCTCVQVPVPGEGYKLHRREELEAVFHEGAGHDCTVHSHLGCSHENARMIGGACDGFSALGVQLSPDTLRQSSWCISLCVRGQFITVIFILDVLVFTDLYLSPREWNLQEGDKFDWVVVFLCMFFVFYFFIGCIKCMICFPQVMSCWLILIWWIILACVFLFFFWGVGEGPV